MGNEELQKKYSEKLEESKRIFSKTSAYNSKIGQLIQERDKEINTLNAVYEEIIELEHKMWGSQQK